MKVALFFLSILLFLSSCHHKAKQAGNNPEPFDKVKWQTKEGGAYPYRDEMLTTLLATDTLRRLKRDSILNLLGEPTRVDTNYLFYRVKQKLFAGMFPLSTKTLVIKFKEDSSVMWIKVHE